jgi:hypothetical protein
LETFYFGLYLLNLFDAFGQLFVMVKEYRHQYRIESCTPNRIGAGRNVDLGMSNIISSNFFLPDLSKALGNGFQSHSYNSSAILNEDIVLRIHHFSRHPNPIND